MKAFVKFQTKGDYHENDDIFGCLTEEHKRIRKKKNEWCKNNGCVWYMSGRCTHPYFNEEDNPTFEAPYVEMVSCGVKKYDYQNTYKQ